MIDKLEFTSGDFFTASKVFAEDPNLSPEAKGVLAYLSTKPEDWTPRESDLVRSHPCKEYKIRTILKELREKGYMNREKIRKEDGTFDWKGVICDHPRFRPGWTGSDPEGVRPGSDRGYSNNDSEQELNPNKNEGDAPPPGRESAVDPPLSEEDAVALGEEEDIPEDVARNWWLYHDARAWDTPIKNPRSSLRRWHLNEYDRPNGQAKSIEDLKGEKYTESEIGAFLSKFEDLSRSDFVYAQEERGGNPLYTLQTSNGQ